MNLKKILPMEINLEIKNFPQYFKENTIGIPVSDGEPRLFFLDAASYNNMGDQAIAYAISVFLQQEYSSYDYIEVSEKELLRNLKLLKTIVTSHDIICLSGGGNMGNLYPKYEALRRKVVKCFPNNRIIIFPQTLNYENDSYGQRELRRSAKIYNNHPYLSVFARELKSYKAMSAVYNNVFLAPDIVLYLSGKIETKIGKVNGLVGICLRDDKESVLSNADRDQIVCQVTAKGSQVVQLSTMSQAELITQDTRRGLLQEKLDEFSKCSLIITDRLHGMIFSILSGVPCIAIDNSNHKISGVLEIVSDWVQNVKIATRQEFSDIQAVLGNLSGLEAGVTIDDTLYSLLIERICVTESESGN